MKSRLAVSFDGVTDRERKHLDKEAFGIKGAQALGRRIDRAFLGRLAFGPSLFGVLGRKIGQTFLGRLTFGPSPIETLGLGQLVRGIESGPMIPTCMYYDDYYTWLWRLQKRESI